VGPRAGLDGCGKSCPLRDSNPGPSSPWGVAIPTELSQPAKIIVLILNDFFVSYFCFELKLLVWYRVSGLEVYKNTINAWKELEYRLDIC
jgi:hypothetical protein